MLFEAYGGKAIEKSRVSEWIKQLSEGSHVEITNEGNAHHLFDITGTVYFEFTPPCSLSGNTEAVTQSSAYKKA
jgi:hypothetical protein